MPATLLHSGDNRWSLPTREQMAASSLADARAVLDGPLAHSPIEVIIVGDISVDEAIRETAATFGALPPRTGTPAPADRIRFPAGTRRRRSGSPIAAAPTRASPSSAGRRRAFTTIRARRGRSTCSPSVFSSA